MEILRRYASSRTYQDKNGNTVSGRYKRLDKSSQQYSEILTEGIKTLDIISMENYGTPLLFWLIADMNNIIDPMIDIPSGAKLKIPVI